MTKETATLQTSRITARNGVSFDHAVEQAEFNQYWYSRNTVNAIIEEVRHHATACAFLSTPSLFFALVADANANASGASGVRCNSTAEQSYNSTAGQAELVSNSRLFEFDRQWKEEPGFVFYDFRRPQEVPVQFMGAFDYVVADPPFITADVWEAYVQTAKLLIKHDGKLLFTTVLENHTMLEGLLDGPLFIAPFRPAIEHLTYQYVCFTNYKTTRLARVNEELPADDPKVAAAVQMANDLRESEKAFTAQIWQRNRSGEQPLPALQRANAAKDSGEHSALVGLPINEMRWGYIPEGLTVYANGSDVPPAEPVGDGDAVDYGETYHDVVRLRELLDTFKRQIDHLQKLLDQLLKLSQRQQRRDNPQGSSSGEVRPPDVSCREQFMATLEQMREITADVEVAEAKLAVLRQGTGFGHLSAMRECVEAYAAAPLQKQELSELAADATRKYKSPVFNRMKELLQWMKEIKKQHQELHKRVEAMPETGGGS
ncbi:putative N6 adenine methyltransferase [Trypanosoma vivax]|uniref:N6-adenine methyltransferase n=1 Tax=Trypanosoma vivax (strain Y486) TaxID=1055687 RepID=G0TZC3_TRYVY|nr:hypothetical protein TRVL_07443 [Trypanosoma vivax]KAH8620514.1 putative N6 adenine methyltransferase [Trypanosoma vivax]CCC49326.1 conserved hypothetical protein [Trypanosoma vivax Y486]